MISTLDHELFSQVVEMPTAIGSVGYSRRDFELQGFRAYVETKQEHQPGGWRRTVYKVYFNDPRSSVNQNLFTPKGTYEFTDIVAATSFAQATLVTTIMIRDRVEDQKGEAVFEDRD